MEPWLWELVGFRKYTCPIKPEEILNIINLGTNIVPMTAL
jgi:hypothetical protein